METSGVELSPWLLLILSAASASAKFDRDPVGGDEEAAQDHGDDQQYSQCAHCSVSPTLVVRTPVTPASLIQSGRRAPC